VDPGRVDARGEGAAHVGDREPVVGAPVGVAQVGDGAREADPAAGDDRQLAAQLLDLHHQVGGQQDRQPLLGERRHEPAHVAHASGVEPVRRLVEQQQPRPSEQRGGQPQALAHALRVAPDLVVAATGQLDDLQHLLDPFVVPAAVQGREQVEVPTPGQVGVERGRLDEAGHPVQRPHALGGRVAAEQLDVARGRPDQAQHHPQRRGLAGAVRAEVAVHGAGRHVEVDPVDRHDVAELLAQTPQADGWGVRGRGHLPSVARPLASAGLESRPAGTCQVTTSFDHPRGTGVHDERHQASRADDGSTGARLGARRAGRTAERLLQPAGRPGRRSGAGLHRRVA
jgi:hypothetical protein